MSKLPSKLFSFILFFLKKQWQGFSFMALTMAFWALNEALYPYFSKVLIDRVQSLQPGLASPLHELSYPLLSLMICWFVMEISMRSLGFVSISIWPKFRKNIREAAFTYTQGHSHTYFSNNFAGSIANKISELPRACEQIVDIFIMSFFAIILTFCISLFVVFQVSAIFGFILLGWVTIFMILTFLYLSRINRASEIHAEAISTLNGQVVDSLSGIMAVRLFARFRYEIKHLSKYQKDEINKSQHASWAVEELNIFRGALSFIFLVVIFIALVYGWNEKWVSIGDFSLITITSFNLMGLVWHFAYNVTHVVREIGTAQAALSLLNIPHGITDVPHAKSFKITQGEIFFDKVTFQYKRNSNIFKDKTVKIKAGQKVGLVGFSGSGKSTFANLILRFFDITSGKILIDGQDISKVTQESLWSQIAMIPQEPTLFHRTLRENIRYGRLEATDEEVKEAARLAHCEEFIHHLEHGYDTIVGERGLKLSGGQRQRIAIARAILKVQEGTLFTKSETTLPLNKSIFIMDEATSALDSETEKLIQESLKLLMKNRTSLLIAHRLSTLKGMDRILVFEGGHIIEDGSVRSLLAKKGRFYQLWNMQSGGFLPENAEDLLASEEK